ncbi:PIN domain-containing protein [Aliarcobacter cryaerophilus]|uniref:PIN domain-containing protein n=1 Tax=Aliarcobacter cryaerophilus TaxID=28198 RepID=UPI0021B59EB8|nr:PIN domain-containing protein [Aliarcobacter cryaerophilus]MCT7404823.1 PIN domain-containing protein [Aliarcobacter cryaerophilus]MCT7502569.1 PIN domain-containing protein [Aliarcobacter cryaerophilus]
MLDFLDDEEKYSYINAKFSENEVIYIDSNIFMHEEATYFLDSLNEKNKVIVPKEQYNELYKLKSSDDEKRAYKARNAFRKIEELYDKKIIKIEDLSNLQKEDSYADPVFISLILENIKNNVKVAFISEDRDLRLRLKIEIDRNSSYTNYLHIYNLEDIIERESTRKIETSTLKKTGKAVVGLATIGALIAGALDL